jgi:hypothetical protein
MISGFTSTALAWNPLSTMTLDTEAGAFSVFFASLPHFSQVIRAGALATCL